MAQTKVVRKNANWRRSEAKGLRHRATVREKS